MAEGAGGNESNRTFDRLWTIGVIGGVLGRAGFFRAKKKKKFVMPKEGTAEFDALVKEGTEQLWINLIVIIGAVIFFLRGVIKALFMNLLATWNQIKFFW